MAQHVKLAVLSDEVAADTQTLVYNQDTNRWDPAVSRTTEFAADIAELKSRSGTSVAGIVPTKTALPSNPRDGEAFIVQDETAMYVRNNVGAWVGPIPVQGSATEAAVAAVANKPSVWANLTSNGKRPVGQGEAHENVRHHGAVGNGVADDTVAFQAAIDVAFATGKGVWVPYGNYRVGTLKLPRQISIEGPGSQAEVMVDASTRKSMIAVTADVAFTAQSTTTPLVSLTMRGLTFHKASPANGTDNAVFDGITLRQSEITRCSFGYFDTIFRCVVQNVTRIHGNMFLNIRKAFMGGTVAGLHGIMDSSVDNNYISGNPTFLPDCFATCDIKGARITDNYIDYFKRVFSQPPGAVSMSRTTILGNTMDVCYQIFGGRTLVDVAIVGNLFTNIRASANAFPAPSADMTEWCAIKPGAASSGFTITGNTVQGVTKFVSLTADNMVRFKVIGNSYGATVDTRVEYVRFTSSGNAATNVQIDDLQDLRVTTLPRALLFGDGTVAFDKQRLIYNGVPVFNDNGVWKKYDGTNA